MKEKVLFRMHAYSDAAGKENISAVRNGNEDNFYVDDNLSDEYQSHCESDMVKELCEHGLIMAVADGMGGMNAGEVASEIAVSTVQEFFAPEKISKEISGSHQSRQAYLEKLIVEADKRIKEDARNNPEHEGMGSTIILAWIVGNELTLSWCGDSRAYIYNPVTGIRLISEDHSYVQELVQKGVLTYDQTFDHPQGNIITRSLGDETKKIRPETRFFNVYDKDIVLLCSDGLSGVLRDRKTPDGEGGFFPGDTIEDIMRDNSSSMTECRKALWDAAEKAGWYDNVTVILCEIVSGAGEQTDSEKSYWNRSLFHITPKSLIPFICGIGIIVAFLIFGFKSDWKFKVLSQETAEMPSDSSSVASPVAEETIVAKKAENVEGSSLLSKPLKKLLNTTTAKKDSRDSVIKELTEASIEELTVIEAIGQKQDSIPPTTSKHDTALVQKEKVDTNNVNTPTENQSIKE